MSAKRKTVVAVIFGGRSVEHDVSVVTGNQVMRAFDPDRYEVVPVYITRDGRWFTGEPLQDLNNYSDEIISYKGVYSAILSPAVNHHGLIINPVSGRLHKSEIKRVDVVFPAVHGTHGEDGTLQGLLELADIPYVGCGVLASAVANDKALTKDVLQQHGIPVVDGLVINRQEWLEQRAVVLERVATALPYPLFVKPATLGSSIGVARAEDATMLSLAIDIATTFDHRVIIERAITNSVEINCAVLGYGDNIEPSMLEQPVSWQEFLTYEEKYLREGGQGMKSAERIIPAPISDALAEKIQGYAVAAFKAIDGRGTARIDFLLRQNERGEIGDDSPVYLNEINTMPGSLAFYLWQPMGLSNSDVVDRLVAAAREAHAEKRRNTYDYQTRLIEVTATRGLKGIKGTKTRSSSASGQGTS
jgi:D-alanine-D-alanine ligase